MHVQHAVSPASSDGEAAGSGERKASAGGPVGCAERCAAGYALDMADTDPVTSPPTDPAYAQGDQDAEPTMTAPSGSRPDAATDPDPSDEYADKPDAEGAS